MGAALSSSGLSCKSLLFCFSSLALGLDSSGLASRVLGHATRCFSALLLLSRYVLNFINNGLKVSFLAVAAEATAETGLRSQFVFLIEIPHLLTVATLLR